MEEIYEFTKEEENLFLKIKNKLFTKIGGISLDIIDYCYDKRYLSDEVINLLDKIKIKKHLIRSTWREDDKDLYVFNKHYLNNIKYTVKQ